MQLDSTPIAYQVFLTFSPVKRVRLWLASTLACCLILTACKQETRHPEDRKQELTSAKMISHQPGGEIASSTGGPATVHDPAHPPIDCPLRKHGIDPSQMRPFEDVEKYIAFLEREERAVWQKPDAVVSALQLSGDETVVDLGAGSGYFAFRFAKALTQGKVIAADIEPEMVRHIHHKAMTKGVGNIEARLINADDPSVPPEVDLVFICDVLHHVSNRSAWLSKLTKAMPSGARLALIEFKEGNLPEGPPESVKLPKKELVRLLTDAGLTFTAEHDQLLPYQSFLVFRKP